ncbi:hypothetical protein [Raineya sp.]|jgi:hypothetical protein
MKKSIIITSDKITADLLQKILPANVWNNCKVFKAAGDTSAISMARSAAILDYDKVLLVLNVNQKSIVEKENSAKEILNLVFSNAEIKVKGIDVLGLLLLDKNFLEQFFGKSISEVEFEMFLLEPEYALSKLGAGVNQQKIAESILDNMTDSLRGKIQKNIDIIEIVGFLEASFAYES